MTMMLYDDHDDLCMDNLMPYVSQPTHLQDSLTIVAKVFSDISMRFGLGNCKIGRLQEGK